MCLRRGGAYDDGTTMPWCRNWLSMLIMPGLLIIIIACCCWKAAAADADAPGGDAPLAPAAVGVAVEEGAEPALAEEEAEEDAVVVGAGVETREEGVAGAAPTEGVAEREEDAEGC